MRHDAIVIGGSFAGLSASADGVTAGLAVHRSLVFPVLEAARREP